MNLYRDIQSSSPGERVGHPIRLINYKLLAGAPLHHEASLHHRIKVEDVYLKDQGESTFTRGTLFVYLASRHLILEQRSPGLSIGLGTTSPKPVLIAKAQNLCPQNYSSPPSPHPPTKVSPIREEQKPKLPVIGAWGYLEHATQFQRIRRARKMPERAARKEKSPAQKRN